MFLYIGVDYYYNSKNYNNAIFVWGDSQTYRGLDLQVLEEKTDKKVYSYAVRGAGVYDFLNFSEKIPDNSTVILGVSKPSQLRGKEKDKNMSGISIKALLILYENGYSFKELISIIKKNRIPNKTLQEYTNLYKYNDKIVFSKPIKFFENIYANIPPYLIEKQRVYNIGIQKLRDKHCNIIFIDFPYHPILEAIEHNSIVNKQTTTFTNHIIRTSKTIEIDTLVFDSDKQIMYDLTHLNEIGAEYVSEFVSVQINKYEHITKSTSNKGKWSNYEVYCFLY